MTSHTLGSHLLVVEHSHREEAGHHNQKAQVLAATLQAGGLLEGLCFGWLKGPILHAKAAIGLQSRSLIQHLRLAWSYVAIVFLRPGV